MIWFTSTMSKQNLNEEMIVPDDFASIPNIFIEASSEQTSADTNPNAYQWGMELVKGICAVKTAYNRVTDVKIYIECKADVS